MGSKREERVEKTIGPGAYDANNEVIKDRVVSYKMGNTKRSDLVNKE